MCETKAILIDTSEEGCIEATPGAVKSMSGGPWILESGQSHAVGIQSGSFEEGSLIHSLSLSRIDLLYYTESICLFVVVLYSFIKKQLFSNSNK